MRIAIISDIHADLVPNGAGPSVVRRIADEVRAAEADVLLIPGDMVNHHSQLERFLAPLAAAPRNLYLPGNHDVWLSKREIARGFSSFDALERLRSAASNAGFTYLPGNPQLIDGVGFAGSLGWYDYGFADPSLPVNPEQYAAKALYGRTLWNDAHFARWTVDGRRLADPEVAERFTAELERDLQTLGLDADGSGPATVAATHHLPYRELLIVKGRLEWDFCNAFMGTPTLGALYDRLPAVRLIAAGHTHSPRRAEFDDGRRVIVSPLGYQVLGEWPSEIAERLAVVELA